MCGQNIRQVNNEKIETDLALGDAAGPFLKNSDGTSAYDRYVEIEIPANSYVYMGYAAKQNDRFVGGGNQVWFDNTVRNSINWDVPHIPLAQY